MFYTKKVREYYNEAIRLHPTAPDELKHSLRSNERVPSFIDNLALEIQKVQDMRLAQDKNPFPDKTIQSLVYDMTNIFIGNVEKLAQERMMSDLDKQAIKAKADYQKDLQASASGKLSGEFEELVEFTDDSRDVL